MKSFNLDKYIADFEAIVLPPEDTVKAFVEKLKTNYTSEMLKSHMICLSEILESYYDLFNKKTNKGVPESIKWWAQHFKSCSTDIDYLVRLFGDSDRRNYFYKYILPVFKLGNKNIDDTYEKYVSNTVNNICPKIIKRPRLEESKDLHNLKLSFRTRISGMLYIGDSILPIKNMKLFNIIFTLQNWIRYNPRKAMFEFSKPTKDANSNLIRFSGNIKQYNVNVNIGFDSSKYDNRWKCMANNMDGTKYGIVFSGNFSSSSNVIPNTVIAYEPESDIYINLGVETVIYSIIIGTCFESNISKAEFDEFLNKLVDANNVKYVDADDVMYGGKVLQKTFKNIDIKSDYVPGVKNTRDIEYEVVWNNLCIGEAAELYAYIINCLEIPKNSYTCSVGYRSVTLKVKNVSYANLNSILLNKKIKKYDKEINMLIYINVR